MSPTTESGTECVEYHAPKSEGSCDECGDYFNRATHLMDSGEDLCGVCYGKRKGYIVE